MRLEPINLYDYEARAQQVLTPQRLGFYRRRGDG